MLHTKTLRHINKLQQKKYRKEFNEFTVEGVKGVGEAIASKTAEVILLIVEGNKREENIIAELIKEAEKQGIPVEFAGRKDIGALKTTETFSGVMAVIEIPEVAPQDFFVGKPIICLDGVKDPGNLGTIIRTADWFGVEHILLSEDSVDPYNPKVVRSTMGSIFHTHILSVKNLANTLAKAKETYRIFSFEMDGAPLSAMKSKHNTIYVFGSESHGVRKELHALVDTAFTISGTGSAESLNLAVSAGIVMSRI